MSRKFRSIGNRQRACYLKAGDVVALKAAPSLPSGQHFAATTARDAVAATIQRVETSRRGGWVRRAGWGRRPRRARW